MQEKKQKKRKGRDCFPIVLTEKDIDELIKFLEETSADEAPGGYINPIPEGCRWVSNREEWEKKTEGY